MEAMLPLLALAALALAGCTGGPDENARDQPAGGGGGGGVREVTGQVTVVGEDTNSTTEGNATTNETNETR